MKRVSKRPRKKGKKTIAHITPEQSEIWLDFYETLSEEQLDSITKWLARKGFYDTNNAGKIKFFLKIDGNRYLKHKSFVWRIIYLNKMIKQKQ